MTATLSAPNHVLPKPSVPLNGGGRDDGRDSLRFMFSVGIECSNPISTDGIRVDELALTGHYEFWKKDFANIRNLGVRYVRYGPPIHKIFLGPGEYDWTFCDMVMEEMKRLDIRPIIDLVHFGLPDWLKDFQNPDWPKHVADYADAFSRRYPWVRFYTPVNEIYVTAVFSGLFGWWNERRMDDTAFVSNIKHCCQASLLIMQAILANRSDAIFVFSESTEYVHPGSPTMVPRAVFMNERRFLSLDLLFGHDVSAQMYRYLLNSGMKEQEYQWFRQQHSELRSHCIMGTDYYITNEHILRDDGHTMAAGDVYGYYVITKQYFDRYKMPVMHTETNRTGKHAIEWMYKEWMNLLRLREDGVPIIGFTWYGLVDMIDWDSALTRLRGHVNNVGLFTLDRRPRKLAKEFKRLVETYSQLPISSSKMLLLTA
jgi:beta-glucosidase/6-phospho-beta-glucosidase/beta-galactosidase